MNNIVFKEVFEYDSKKILNLEKRNFFEIKCEPTYEGNKVLFCNKKDLTFDEITKILGKTKNKTVILGLMSFIYYKFYSEFYFYVLNLEERTKKVIIKKTKKFFIRWNLLAERSDDLLYPQNRIIKKLYEEEY